MNEEPLPTEKAYKDHRKNIYTCGTCWDHIVTIDKHKGVTPMFLDCKTTKGCDGMMRSSIYNVCDKRMRTDYEWYKPSVLQNISSCERDHVKNGGLLLKKLSLTDAILIEEAGE